MARNPVFDTARFVLIVLVVIGHSLAYLKDVSVSADTLYRVIYAFHMPAFVFITGYLARTFVWNENTARRTIETLVVPAVLFELVSQYALVHWAGENIEYNVLVTQWLGWFLWAMVVWRVVTPVFRALRYPVLTAIFVSLASGFVTVPNVIGLPKAFALLPFYVMGMAMTEARFARLRVPRVRRAASLTFVGLVLAAYVTRDLFPTTTLLWKRAYDDAELGTDPWVSLCVRAVLILVGLAVTLSFMSVISARETWASRFGTRTLYCYLLHGFGVLAAVRFGAFDAVPENAVGTGIVVVVAVAWALVLLTPPVRTVFRPVLEPVLPWAFKPTRGTRT